MRKLCLFVFIVLSIASPFPVNASTAIVGGQDAQLGEYPWHVMLITADGKYQCGGSLIRLSWVLTAAHCIDHDKMKNGSVMLGAHRRTAIDEVNRQIIGINSITVHPFHGSFGFTYDVGLIELATSAVITVGVNAILLSSPSWDGLLSVPGQMSIVTGWGRLYETGSLADILQEVTIPIISNSECGGVHGRHVSEYELCAGATGKDACYGDSGGALVALSPFGDWRQVGIVSWGNGCGHLPGGYTRVASFYLWIQQTIGSGTMLMPEMPLYRVFVPIIEQG